MAPCDSGELALARCHRVLNIDLRVLYQKLVRIARGKPLVYGNISGVLWLPLDSLRQATPATSLASEGGFGS